MGISRSIKDFFLITPYLIAIGIGVISIGLAMWWLFYWAGENYDLLDMKLPGPIIATVGFTTIGYCCSRRRGSILNPQSTNKLSAPNE